MKEKNFRFLSCFIIGVLICTICFMAIYDIYMGIKLFGLIGSLAGVEVILVFILGVCLVITGISIISCIGYGILTKE